MFAICFADVSEKELKIASLQSEVESLKILLEKEKKRSDDLLKLKEKEAETKSEKETEAPVIPKGMVDLTKIKFYHD